MLLRSLRRLADIRWAFLVAVLIAIYSTCVDVLSDPDVWWHIRTGQWILDNHRLPATEMYSYATAADSPWTYPRLFEIVFAVLYNSGGLLLLALVVALLTWSGFVALALRCVDRGLPPLAIAGALLIGAKAAQPVTGTRTQMATFALLCWVLWLAERQLDKGGRWRWALPPIFLVWANLHAGVIAGLGALVVIICVAAWRRRQGVDGAAAAQHIRGLATVTALSVVAACVNPYGPRLLVFSLNSSSNNFSKFITEWASPDFHNTSLQFLLIFLVGLIVLGALARQRRLDDILLSGIGAGAALLAVRNAALVVAMAVPLWADGLAGLGDVLGLRRRTRAAAGAAVVVAGCLLTLTGFIPVGVSIAAAAGDAQPSGIARVYPTCAAAALMRAPAGTRVFAPYFDGGYIIFRDWPRSSVFAYGESEAIGSAVINRYATVATGSQSPSALQMLYDSGTTVVLTDAGGQLAAALDNSGTWQRTAIIDRGLQMWVLAGASWASAGC